MRRQAKEQIHIKEITKDVFSKFKKVRELQSQLYGSYHLYSKNGFKYVGKHLSTNFQLDSTRNTNYPIFKYSSNQECIYLFPLHGQPLSNVVGKMQQDGQVKRWIDKCGSYELCLFDILKKMVQLVQVYGQQEIILQCLRVFNGELQYCYDNWMKSSFFIVLNNPTELENYYFSQEDLDNMKQLTQNKVKSSNINLSISKVSTVYRIFLMILHLGTHNLKQRNYEFTGDKLHQEHLKLRVQYFCSRYNQKGLGDLVRKIILNETMDLDQVLKVCYPETNQNSKVKKVLTYSHAKPTKQRRRMNTQIYNDSQTPIKQSYISRLNYSNFTHNSNKSNKQEENNLEVSKYSLYKSNIVNDQNKVQPKQSKIKENIENNKDKKNIKLFKKTSLSKDSKDIKQYHLFANGPKEKFNFKNILLQTTQIPKNNIKILKYFGLEEYFPNNLYEEHILSVLSNIHIKSNWVKQIYENGSIYIGEIANHKKQGKGLYLFNSNDFYFGDWASNFMDGYGTYVFVSGEVYQGQLKKGFKQGHGKCAYPDGKSYEGFWNKNNKIGLGKVKFPNQVIFIGLFKPHSAETEGLFLGPIGEDGKPLWQNKGVLEHYHWQKNTLVQNKDKQNQIDRKSKLKNCKNEYYSQSIDDDGNQYQGEMVDGKKEGFGIYEAEKDIYEGQWCEDKKFGCGTLLVKNLFHISGEWKNNILIKYNYQQMQQSF